jgi:hypothetical protein
VSYGITGEGLASAVYVPSSVDVNANSVRSEAGRLSRVLRHGG